MTVRRPTGAATRGSGLATPGTSPAPGQPAAVPAMVRTGLACGLLGPLLWAAAIVLAGMQRPGFDHVSQYISELGERGSSTEAFMRYGGFVPTGLLHVAFAAALRVVAAPLTARPRLTLLVAALIAANGLGRIAAGIFNCEPGCGAPDVPGQRLHSLAATMAFLAVAAAALLGGLLFRRCGALGPLASYSVASGCAGVLFLALMSAGGAERGDAGLYERLASGVLSLWVFVTAVRLRSALAGRNSMPRPPV